MGTNWETGTNTHTLRCIKQTVTENLLYSTGNSTWCSVVTYWEANPRKKRHMYTHGWFTLLYSRNWHSSVKQLYSNFFFFLKKATPLAKLETVQPKVIIALTRPQEKLNLLALCFHDTAEKAVPLNWKESF